MTYCLHGILNPFEANMLCNRPKHERLTSARMTYFHLFRSFVIRIRLETMEGSIKGPNEARGCSFKLQAYRILCPKYCYEFGEKSDILISFCS